MSHQPYQKKQKCNILGVGLIIFLHFHHIFFLRKQRFFWWGRIVFQIFKIQIFSWKYIKNQENLENLPQKILEFCFFWYVLWLIFMYFQVKNAFSRCCIFLPLYFPSKPYKWCQDHNFRQNILFFLLQTFRNRPLHIAAIWLVCTKGVGLIGTP